MFIVNAINASQDIVVEHTDFWGTEHAKKGLFFLNFNAGAARLLVPDNQRSAIAEMLTAKEVLLSRGKMNTDIDDREGYELLFEDHSLAPFCIYMDFNMVDRALPAKDQGRKFPLTVWTRNGCQGKWTCRYRIVKSIPYLKPWGK